MEFTKYYIKFYAIFMLLVGILNISGVGMSFPAIPIIEIFNAPNIIMWVFDIATWLIGIITYTLPTTYGILTALNYLLWGMRIIVLIELAVYVKDLLNPLS